MPTTMEQCFAIIVGEEGAYGNDPRDPGNWTGGRVGVGVNKGTKYGISAKSYPNLDIANLTLAQAQNIFQQDYFLKFHCDQLPPPLALLVADTAYNGGHPIEWMQTAVGATPDGSFGPKTLAAINAHNGQGTTVCAKFLSLRLSYDSDLAVWSINKHGWITRVINLAYLAMRMT